MKLSGPALPIAADLLHDFAAIDAAIDQIADALNFDFAGTRPLFLTMLQGGLLFAGHLAPRLTIDCDYDYLHASRYRGETSGGDITWFAQPRESVEGRSVLLIDDILDEGETLLAVRDWCLSQGAIAVTVVALCVKDHDRCNPAIDADYSGLIVPDRYVFGFGMDYHEKGRGLPGIYAVQGA